VLSPKLVEVGRHLNIELITNAEVESIEGESGDFTVTLESKPRYVDVTRCTGCGDCAEVCQFDAIDIINGKAVMIQEKCMGCGVCVSRCSNGALTLERDASKGEPLEIHALMERALGA